MDTLQGMTPEVAPLSDADRLAAIKLSAANFAEGDTLSTMATAEIVKALSGATFAQWEAAATVWQSSYRTERAERNSPVDEKSAARAWQRLVKGAALDKPASPSPEAKAKSEYRERVDAGLKAQEMLSDDALAESVESLRPFAAEGLPRAVERMVTLKAEQARRAKAREDAESATTKQLRADCAELLKVANHELLTKVRALLKGEIDFDMPEGEGAPDLTSLDFAKTGTEG